ncbi:MAG: site-specific integrase [Rikenellaceae bacterium]
MKVTAIIKKSTKRYDTESQATIYLRVRDGRKFDSVAPTKLSINPNLWDDKAEQIKSKVVCDDQLRLSINNEIRNLKSYIENEYSKQSEGVDKEWLRLTLDIYYNPNKYKVAADKTHKPTVDELFEEFLLKHKISEVRQKNYKVVKRILKRYELLVRTIRRGQKSYILYVEDITADTLRDIWDFADKEHLYYDEYPMLYEKITESRIPKPRGRNTLLGIFSKIRTFIYWCNDNKGYANKSFSEFSLEECTYGTPVYITIDERNKIYRTNLKRHPKLAIQRDIFVFQCLIGCRIGNFLKMKKSNVICGAIEYIPRKTKDGRPETVRVPLNDTALEILERYKDCEGDSLLPFISEQKYNVSIKRIFKAAGLKRMVTIINPTTREEEKRVLYEIASSHLARRTFVGNLYKQVKDPNLVGSLSGHKEGSKAFARYRDIDEEMKRELVNMLG